MEEKFPSEVLEDNHPIAHLELLNLIVAVKFWQKWWAGHQIEIQCDNMNTCLLIMSGKSVDPFIQKGARELYMVVAANDIDLNVVHTPGLPLVLADALSREHLDMVHADIVKRSEEIKYEVRVFPQDSLFKIENNL